MNPDELKTRREALGMTQSELAQELSVDVMTISRWERGARTIPTYLPLALETIERRFKKPSSQKKAS